MRFPASIRYLTLAITLLLAQTMTTYAADNPASQININAYKFMPEKLSVPVGSKVTWVNKDDVPHTVVESAVNKNIRSSALDTNDSYSFTFTKPGTYRYFCTLHPQMVGTVVVTAAP